ncbi:MAG TPA: hypothetical protein VNZ62_20200 [Capillimicrobium sp.]|nr:hypothetical protein [Capillimicrobium sp.]
MTHPRTSLARRAALAAAVALLGAAPATAGAAPPVTVKAAAIAAPLGETATAARVTITNTTSKRLRGLRLSVGRAKGVGIAVQGARRGRLTRALPALGPGRTARVTVRLRRLQDGPQTGAVAVRVTRGKRTVGSARLRFGTSGSTTAPRNPNTLAGRYFWGSTYTINGIRQKTLYFTGDDLVFTDDTESAWPTCAAESEQCRPYRYTAASGELAIDGQPAELAGRRLKLDGQTYFEFGIPQPGARFDTRVTYANARGICPLMCSYHTENLTFRPDGTFARDSVSSGSSPVVDWASIPTDSKGTYEVRADGTLRLAYESGTERIETIGLYLDESGALKPAGEGMILGGDGYFDIRD